MTTSDNFWERYKTPIHIIADFLGGIVGVFTFAGTNWGMVFFGGIGGIFVSHCLVTLSYFNWMIYPNLRTLRDHQLLLGGVTNFLQEAQLIDSDKRAVAMDFVVSSLKCITFKGFLEVDLPFHQFLKYIERLAKKSDKKAFGTSPVRPKELSKDTQARKYLKIILKSPVESAIRISIFRDCELTAIVQEALDGLQAATQVQTNSANDIPEIAWWVTEANGLSYSYPMYPSISYNAGAGKCLLWTTHQLHTSVAKNSQLVHNPIRGSEVEDYAIFDDMLVVKYRPNHEPYHGTLFLLWGKNRVDEYLKSPESIEECFDPKIAAPLQAHGMYKSFIELLEACPHLTIDMTSSPFAVILKLSGYVNLATIYRNIIAEVNNGKLAFTPQHLGAFHKL